MAHFVEGIAAHLHADMRGVLAAGGIEKEGFGCVHSIFINSNDLRVK